MKILAISWNEQEKPSLYSSRCQRWKEMENVLPVKLYIKEKSLTVMTQGIISLIPFLTYVKNVPCTMV